MATIETLGKYEIRRVLGRGSAGTVLEGWDPAIRRRVAIKTVRMGDVADPDVEEQIGRFRREAQAAGRLIHPNIVTVHDYGETEDVAYIVMEFVEGPSLRAFLDKRQPCPLADTVRIMEDVLAGLEFSHERGIVHRDIKPANVMLTSHDLARARAKIADFGIARIENSSLTQVGTIVGTPAYMSPEQFMGETINARSDIYGAGILLYQLLTGERPFDGTISAVMHKVLSTEAPAPSAMSVHVPTVFDAVVRRAIAKRPDHRFPSAAAFAAALRAAKEANDKATAPPAADLTIREPAPAAVASAKAPQEGTSGTRVALPWVLGGLAVAMIAAGGGVAVWLSAHPLTTGRPPPTVVAETRRMTPSPAVPADPRTPVISRGESPPARDVQAGSISANAPSANAPLVTAPLVTAPLAAPPPATASIAPPVAAPVIAVPALSRAEVQARLGRLIAGLRCSLVQGRMDGPDRAALGGIAGTGAEASIRADLAVQDLPVTLTWVVASAGREFCPVLETLRPITPVVLSGEPPLVLKLAEDRTTLRDGEPIRPRLIMPPYKAYLYVDYIAHDGTVQHLYPQTADPANGIAGDAVRVFAPAEWVNLGDPQPGQRGWEASEPFGTDMIIAIAAARPLFDRPRPANAEPAWDYLRALEVAIQTLKRDQEEAAATALLVDVTPK
ncbi:MAG: serine/threonine-protein kinase [Acetobacteraceae bacterium]